MKSYTLKNAYGMVTCSSREHDGIIAEELAAETVNIEMNEATASVSEVCDRAKLQWLEARFQELKLDNREYTRQADKERTVIFSQKDIMWRTLLGMDTFVILPTGSGKSFCFQKPAIFLEGITLVISPLVALIDDQVDQFNYPEKKTILRKKNVCVDRDGNEQQYEGIWYKAIHPKLEDISLRTLFDKLHYGEEEPDEDGNRIVYKLLYVSPEKLNTPKFVRMLKESKDWLKISHIVIDEVHCISQWGYDFRESYLHIPRFIKQLPFRPVISAYTATAAFKDRLDIERILFRYGTISELSIMADMKSKTEGRLFFFEKKDNLKLHVWKCAAYGWEDSVYYNTTEEEKAELSTLPDRYQKLKELISAFIADERHLILKDATYQQDCIIYRTTAVGVEELYEQLMEDEDISGNPVLDEKIKANITMYHAKLRDSKKHKNISLYNIKSEELHKRIIISTKALGLGVDKKNVVSVIHYDIPLSLEDYRQEVGRAGRFPKDMIIEGSKDTSEKSHYAYTSDLNCHLLYEYEPKRTVEGLSLPFSRGALTFTVNWMMSHRFRQPDCFSPIASQFSGEVLRSTYFWAYYRMSKVYDFCEKMHSAKKYGSEFDPQQYINNYIEKVPHKINLSDLNFFIRKRTLELGNRLGADISCYVVEPERINKYIINNNSDMPETESYTNQMREQYEALYDHSYSEMESIAGNILEININNTFLANLLRDHPEEYTLTRDEAGKVVIEYVMPPNHGQKWRSANNKVIRGRQSFTLRTTDFDCGAAFIFVPSIMTDTVAQVYINLAVKKSRDVVKPWEVIFTVEKEERYDENHKLMEVKLPITGLYLNTEGVWTKADFSDETVADQYGRYLGGDVRAMFPKDKPQYRSWRSTYASALKADAVAKLRAAEKRNLFVNIKGPEIHSLNFTIKGAEAPNYFDMCVLDAIYSAEVYGRNYVYVNDIWAVMTGDNNRAPKNVCKKIEDSIEKLRTLKIRIEDNQADSDGKFYIKDHVSDNDFVEFLSLEKTGKGYAFEQVPALFEYAHELNGEIIKATVPYFTGINRYIKDYIFREDCHFSLLRKDGHYRYNKKYEVGEVDEVTHPKSWEYVCKNLQNIWESDPSKKVVQKNPLPDIEVMMITHYLLRRISVFVAKKKCEYISISTIRHAIGSRTENEYFNKKVVYAITRLKYLRYIDDFLMYLKDYEFLMTDGSVVRDNAYFQVSPLNSIRFTQQKDGRDYVYSENTTTWNPFYGGLLLDGTINKNAKDDLYVAISLRKKAVCKEAENKLFMMPMGRMDGIALIYYGSNERGKGDKRRKRADYLNGIITVSEYKGLDEYKKLCDKMNKYDRLYVFVLRDSAEKENLRSLEVPDKVKFIDLRDSNYDSYEQEAVIDLWVGRIIKDYKSIYISSNNSVFDSAKQLLHNAGIPYNSCINPEESVDARIAKWVRSQVTEVRLREFYKKGEIKENKVKGKSKKQK